MLAMFMRCWMERKIFQKPLFVCIKFVCTCIKLLLIPINTKH